MAQRASPKPEDEDDGVVSQGFVKNFLVGAQEVKVDRYARVTETLSDLELMLRSEERKLIAPSSIASQ